MEKLLQHQPEIISQIILPLLDSVNLRNFSVVSKSVRAFYTEEFYKQKIKRDFSSIVVTYISSRNKTYKDIYYKCSWAKKNLGKELEKCKFRNISEDKESFHLFDPSDLPVRIHHRDFGFGSSYQTVATVLAIKCNHFSDCEFANEEIARKFEEAKNKGDFVLLQQDKKDKFIKWFAKWGHRLIFEGRFNVIPFDKIEEEKIKFLDRGFIEASSLGYEMINLVKDLEDYGVVLFTTA